MYDRWWSVPPVLTSWNIGRAHIGTENLLLGLWDKLGVDVDWSLALHVYGDADAKEFNMENKVVRAYTWRTVNEVAAWQLEHLKIALDKSSSSYTVETAPHRFLACTEQGQQASQYPDTERAKWLCQAANYTAGVKDVLFYSHNNFQSDGGDDFGFIKSVEADLSNAMTSITYQAMAAAKIGVWKVDSNNYCCVNWQLGCP